MRSWVVRELGSARVRLGAPRAGDELINQLLGNLRHCRSRGERLLVVSVCLAPKVPDRL